MCVLRASLNNNASAIYATDTHRAQTPNTVQQLSQCEHNCTEANQCKRAFMCLSSEVWHLQPDSTSSGAAPGIPGCAATSPIITPPTHTHTTRPPPATSRHCRQRRRRGHHEKVLCWLKASEAAPRPTILPNAEARAHSLGPTELDLATSEMFWLWSKGFFASEKVEDFQVLNHRSDKSGYQFLSVCIMNSSLIINTFCSLFSVAPLTFEIGKLWLLFRKLLSTNLNNRIKYDFLKSVASKKGLISLSKMNHSPQRHKWRPMTEETGELNTTIQELKFSH